MSRNASRTAGGGRRPQRARPTSFSGLAIAGALLLALSACFKTAEPPPEVRLETPTLVMNGFTQAPVHVTAPGTWTIVVEGSVPTGAVSLLPAAGKGGATVVVSVDPSAMPRADQTFTLRLRARVGDREVERVSDAFTFSYPDVTGSVVVAPAGSGAVEPTLSEASLGAEVAALPSGPTTTLIVGLQPAGLTVSQTGVERREPPGLGALSATLSRLGLSSAKQEPFEEADLALVTVPTGNVVAAAEALRATEGVRYVEFPQPLYPASDDPLRSQQWNLDQLGVEPMWGAASGAGVTIAVLDQGFYPRHPDLYANVEGTYDAVTGTGSVDVTNPACETHGTHVAGIAAAVANNREGVAGVAPHARLLLVNLGNQQASNCGMNSAALVRALEYVVNGGDPRAQVVNMSLGTSADLGAGVRDALQAAANAGISLVGAAGNTTASCPAYTTAPIYYPARYPQVLAVAATGIDGLRACYSHRGPEMFVAAPGGTQTDPVLSTMNADGYGGMAGTSMAAPAVAGVIAMLRSAAPPATAGQVAQAISASAIDRGDPGRDAWYGYGFIDPAGAYEALMGGPPEPPEPVAELFLRVAGYPDTLLDDDLAFTLLDAPPGPLTVEVGSDDNGNGILSEPGEWYGAATITVAFGATAPNPGNVVSVEVERVP